MEWLLMVGRVVFGAYFVYNGLNHFRRLGMMAPYTASMGVPQARLAVVVTGLMLLAGGLSVALGYAVWLGSTLLAAFLVPTAIIMHPYWSVSDPMMRANQQVHFLKNLALAAANLMLIYFGGGPFSLG